MKKKLPWVWASLVLRVFLIPWCASRLLMLFGLSRERVFWIAGIVTVGVVVYYARGQCDDGTFYAAKRVECPSGAQQVFFPPHHSTRGQPTPKA